MLTRPHADRPAHAERPRHPQPLARRAEARRGRAVPIASIVAASAYACALAFAGAIAIAPARALGAAVGDRPLRALHAFRGGDGAWPRGSLTRAGTTLFGRTSIGSAADSGSVFRIEEDGSGFRTLHSFAAGGDNGTGNQPHHQAMLLLAGERLVGAALFGGNMLHPHRQRPSSLLDAQPKPPPTQPFGNGTLFELRTDGSGFGVLAAFDGGRDGSACPHSTPALAPGGDTLWGMTALGGAHLGGTLFAIGVDGRGYRILHSFERRTGHHPHGVVALDTSGRRLLGIARSGGVTPGGREGAGVIFAWDLAAARYDVLHTFESGDPGNGATNDHGYLTLVDGTLYAVTELGGARGEGTIFAIGEDGAGFRVVHSFGAGGDGRRPFGSLVRVGEWLYGTTTVGGARNDGTLFRFRPRDGAYEMLASFDRATTGAFPEDNVIASADGRTLYGLTQAGGAHDPTATLYYGTLFALEVPPAE